MWCSTYYKNDPFIWHLSILLKVGNALHKGAKIMYNVYIIFYEGL